jgi:hypothetical protein
VEPFDPASIVRQFCGKSFEQVHPCSRQSAESEIPTAQPSFWFGSATSALPAWHRHRGATRNSMAVGVGFLVTWRPHATVRINKGFRHALHDERHGHPHWNVWTAVQAGSCCQATFSGCGCAHCDRGTNCGLAQGPKDLIAVPAIRDRGSAGLGAWRGVDDEQGHSQARAPDHRIAGWRSGGHRGVLGGLPALAVEPPPAHRGGCLTGTPGRRPDRGDRWWSKSLAHRSGPARTSPRPGLGVERLDHEASVRA